MKQIIFKYLLILIPFALFSQSEKMRLNFGASPEITRINVGYYSIPYHFKPNEYGHWGNSESGMLSNSIWSFSHLYMINNRNLDKDEPMSRPRFIQNKLTYNDFNKQLTYSLSYGQSFSCYFDFLGFGKMKGYWYGGFSTNKGVNLGLNTYSSNYGIQAEVIYYPQRKTNESILINTPNNIRTNILIYKKIYQNILINGGVLENSPQIGLSYMFKNFRLNSSLFYGKKFRYGLSLTTNI